MKEFVVSSGAKIAIQGISNGRYIRRERNDRLSCGGCHPFLHSDKEDKARSTFVIVLADEEKEKSVRDLTFCTNVFLKAEDGGFLTANPSGEVFIETPESKGDAQSDALEKNLMKFRRWTIISRKNLISRNLIVTTSEVLLKSAFGNYLKTDGTDLTTNSTLIEDKTTFYLQKADELPLPGWAILRPFQSSLYLNSECLSLYPDNETFFGQVGYTGTKLKTAIKFESLVIAERHVLEETLYSLLSGDGQFIKRKFLEDHSSSYFFDHSEEFSISFVEMISRILPLAGLHDKLKVFEELHGGINKGLMLQAFCDGLADVRREFYAVINAAENELARGELDASRLWFYLQSSFKNFSAIDRLLVEISQLKEGTILSVLYNHVVTAFDKYDY